MYKRTRQRQGRDFTHPDKPVRESRKKSIADQLERFKAEVERNTEPVDGHEPEETLRPPEIGR